MIATAEKYPDISQLKEWAREGRWLFLVGRALIVLSKSDNLDPGRAYECTFDANKGGSIVIYDKVTGERVPTKNQKIFYYGNEDDLAFIKLFLLSE